MKKHSDETPDWEAQRNRIIGLGETSIRKSYYPELRQRILELEEKNRELQAAYAEQTSVEEELRRQIDETAKKERALRLNEERLIMAQDIGHSGSWEYSFETNKIWGSSEALRIYGFPPVAGYHPREDIEARIEDKKRVQQAFSDFISGRRDYDIEFTVNPLDGSSRRVVRSIARLEKDAQDKPIRVVGVIQDITGRKNAENALRESEERFRNLIEASPVPIILVRQGLFLYTNSAFCRMTGYDRPADVTGKHLLNFIAPEFQETVARNVAARSRGEPAEVHYESVGIRRDGSRFPYEITVAVINLSDGPVTMAFMSDISGRKEAEEALRESEKKYRHIVETTPDLIWEIDSGGTFTYLSPQLPDVLGYRPEDLRGKPFFILLPPDQIPYVKKAFEGHLSDISSPVTLEVKARHADGHIVDLEIRSASATDESGRLTGFRGITRDISERKSAEKALQVSEERYRSLVDITDTGYLVLDKRGLVVDANEVYLRFTGRSSVAELIGHPVTDWTAPYDLERNAREVEKCIKTGQVRGLEIDYTRPDGMIQPVEINATVFSTDSGDMILTVCRDISERKRTHGALQQARNKLNLLNAVTFQDIQTAAFALSAYQELVKTVLTDAKTKSYIDKQELFLKKMVDTLDFAKNYQEMGMHPPRWQNVHQIFLYAISHLDFLHMKQNLYLGNLEVFADPLLEKALFKIMENVLVHGVRATEITLRYEERPDGLILFIEDNGVGISPAEKNMIFDRGYGKGTGLGLFLVREVFSITGMNIRETGTSGQGTRFEITVPKGTYRFSE